MKLTAKTLTISAIAFTMVACSSQKEQSSTEAKSASAEKGGRGQGGPPTYATLLTEMDANSDGKLSQSEVKGPLQQEFTTIDTDGDGFISKAEFDKAPKPQQGQRPQR